LRLPSLRWQAIHPFVLLLFSSLAGADTTDKAQRAELLLTPARFWIRLGSGTAALRPGRVRVTETDGPRTDSPTLATSPAAEPAPTTTTAAAPDAPRPRSPRRWLIIGAITVGFLLIIA